MAPFLTFSDLSRQELDELLPLSKQAQKGALKKIMKIDRFPGFESNIVLDFHFQNFLWSQQQKMEPEQMSTFISIMKKVLDEMWSQRLSMQAAFEVFKALLLTHSVHRPPYSTGIFNNDEVAKITDYALNTFFRHFKLYQFVYVTHRELQVKVSHRKVIPAPCATLTELDDDMEVNPREQVELVHLFTPPATTREPGPPDFGTQAQEDEEFRNAELARATANTFEARVNERLDKIESTVGKRLDDINEKLVK